MNVPKSNVININDYKSNRNQSILTTIILFFNEFFTKKTKGNDQLKTKIINDFNELRYYLDSDTTDFISVVRTKLNTCFLEHYKCFENNVDFLITCEGLDEYLACEIKENKNENVLH